MRNYVEREKRWQRIYEIGEKKAKELGIRNEEDGAFSEIHERIDN